MSSEGFIRLGDGVHKCMPPEAYVELDQTNGARSATIEKGTLWRCKCGAIHIYDEDRYWRRARRRERRGYEDKFSMDVEIKTTTIPHKSGSRSVHKIVERDPRQLTALFPTRIRRVADPEPEIEPVPVEQVEVDLNRILEEES